MFEVNFRMLKYIKKATPFQVGNGVLNPLCFGFNDVMNNTFFQASNAHL